VWKTLSGVDSLVLYTLARGLRFTQETTSGVVLLGAEILVRSPESYCCQSAVGCRRTGDSECLTVFKISGSLSQILPIHSAWRGLLMKIQYIIILSKDLFNIITSSLPIKCTAGSWCQSLALSSYE
jgi:hypothetical protein